jgi:peptidylprolyl isomerase domain and WD repeat-containing protein 1
MSFIPLTGSFQSKSTPTCITLSPDSSSFVTFSLPDRQIRIFSFLTGKMSKKYDESLGAIQEMQQAGTAVYKVEDMEFGRRLAVEKEIELPGPDGKVPGAWMNAVWDESGAFVLYPTLLGIKGGGPPFLRVACEQPTFCCVC